MFIDGGPPREYLLSHWKTPWNGDIEPTFPQRSSFCKPGKFASQSAFCWSAFQFSEVVHREKYMPLVLHCLPKEQQTVAELNKVKCLFNFCPLLNVHLWMKLLFYSCFLRHNWFRKEEEVSQLPIKELSAVVVFNRKMMTSQTNPGPFPQLPRSLPSKG